MYGAVAWFVPPERYGKSYNGQPLTAVALAAQKQHLGLYLHCGYMADELASVARGFAAAGKRLDMGKACVRFRKAEDLALEVIGDYLSEVSVERFVADYERGQAGRKQKPIVWQRPLAAKASGVKAVARAAKGSAPVVGKSGSESKKARVGAAKGRGGAKKAKAGAAKGGSSAAGKSARGGAKGAGSGRAADRKAAGKKLPATKAESKARSKAR